MESNKTPNQNKGAFATSQSRYLQKGLTKREYIATQIVQGMCAGRNNNESPGANIKTAIKLTDKLLEELSKSEKE